MLLRTCILGLVLASTYCFATTSFEGTAVLNNCSASLITLPERPPNSNGVILTNGHCSHLGPILAGSTLSNIPSYIQVTIYNNQNRPIALQAKRLIYATMTGTDIALYELNKTYVQLEYLGVRPFKLNRKKPKVGMKINIPSAYHFLRFQCKINTIIPTLLEASWTFHNSIRYSYPGCRTINGTSGSPILLASTRSIIGIHSTHNRSGHFCTLNNPCESFPDGRRITIKRASYGQQTRDILKCFNHELVFKTEDSTCTLPRPDLFL